MTLIMHRILVAKMVPNPAHNLNLNPDLVSKLPSAHHARAVLQE